MSFSNRVPCAPQPRFARQRFFFQCVAVALFLAVLAAMGFAGRAAPGEPGLLPTKPSNPTNYPSMEALLRQSPHDTVVLMLNIEEGDKALRKPEAQPRMDNLVKFMEFVDAQRVRVLVSARVTPGVPTIPPSRMLPTEIDAVLQNVTPEYLAFPTTGSGLTESRLHRMTGGKTLVQSKLAGVRNIILIGPRTDYVVFIPTFEAVWNRINVYRNVNLDARIVEAADDNYYTKFIDRMDEAKNFEGSEPLRLPTTLAADPHLHYVPIGNIPGVLQTLPNAKYDGSFKADGTPVPHVHAPGTQARSNLGDFADIQLYDAQIRLALDQTLEKNTRLEHARNPERMTFTVVPAGRADDFYNRTKTMSDAQLRQAVVDMGIAQSSTSVSFADQRGEDALVNGLVELSVDAHATFAGPYYRVGSLLPSQMGAMIVAHPHLPIASVLAKGKKPAISHLQLRACGKRCNANYEVGSDTDLPSDEVEYAKQLVRWLARNGVDVDFVSVHNAAVFVSGHSEHGARSWFKLYGNDGESAGWAYESRLLTTTLDYDATKDTFAEHRDRYADPHIEIVGTKPLPSATHGDMPSSSSDTGKVPDWVADAHDRVARYRPCDCIRRGGGRIDVPQCAAAIGGIVQARRRLAGGRTRRRQTRHGRDCGRPDRDRRGHARRRG